MPWIDSVPQETLSWLLERCGPGPRYLALRDLLDLPASDPALEAARAEAEARGPIAAVLDAMQPSGYWAEPGPGYLPKYYSTVWAVILLAQLGASALRDRRAAGGCAYLLDHALAPGGQFNSSGAPSTTADCLQGNLCWALAALEVEDPRLDSAFEWMARTVTGEGIAPASERQAAGPRYYAGKCGPLFACGANNKLPCGWGAAKVMLALGRIPARLRTPVVERAVQAGVDFLLDNRPAEAGYPNGWNSKPSGNWWKFGFPVYYVTDVLQVVEAAAGLGCGRDPRLAPALELVRAKGGPQMAWALEYDYAGKTYGSFGPKNQPNPWVTLRALRALRAAECS